MICDLAETYHIFNYKALPAELIATLTIGLRDDSRVKLKLSNQKAKLDTLLLAGIFDRLGLLLWTKTKDGQKGTNKPKMVSALFQDNKDNSDVKLFSDYSEFEKERQRIIKGG